MSKADSIKDEGLEEVKEAVEVKTEAASVTEKVEKKEKKEASTVENIVIKDGKVSIFSKERAGKTIVATTGQLISFDGNGYAAVDPKDALYLQKIKGIEIKK